MKRKEKGDSLGFTIIEVLIVLAIAGLVMLVVFLAVPALQRNSRNAQLRSDAALLGGMIREWSLVNLGKLPEIVCTYNDAASTTGEIYISGLAGNCTSSSYIMGTIHPGRRVSYFTSTYPNIPYMPPQTGDIYYAVNNGCHSNGKNFGQTREAGKMALGIRLETSGGSDTQCIEI